jgi:hypothetical protein
MTKKKSSKKEKSNKLRKGNVKKNKCSDVGKISEKEREDFAKACIGLLFGNPDKMQEFSDKHL